jgi:5'-AMP-activated protein kinase catalytic alpha subunit
MEYCNGGELFDYIVSKQHLTERQACRFFQEIVNSLEYLHSLNIAHRDLKPENLLITKNNILKIIDFGLSNFSQMNKLLTTPCGSPCYASPEVVGGKQYDGNMIDIWATGIILLLCYVVLYHLKDKLMKYFLKKFCNAK